MRKIMRKINIIILLVLCLTLLLLTCCLINTVNSETATEEPKTEISQKCSGLTGFTTWFSGFLDDYGDTWLDNGFTELRDLGDYLGENVLKPVVIEGNAKGLRFIWGVSSVSTTITAENWADFRQGILDAAQWAQDNGVYEFQIGNEEELHNDDDTMTDTELIVALKSVATEVQVIFTNGNISYSCYQGSIDDWVAAGKGDIDILASNVYMGGDGYYSDSWKTKIAKLVNAFGADGTYITEFAPSYSSLEDYSTDEAVQAAGVTEMIEYIKASGIKRALFYTWKGDDFGVVKNDGTYRLLWNKSLLSTHGL